MKRRIRRNARNNARTNARIVSAVRRDVKPARVSLRQAQATASTLKTASLPAHPVHAKSTTDVALMVTSGKFPKTIVTPETFIDVSDVAASEKELAPAGINSLTNPLIPMPNILTGCSTISRKRTVQVVVGSGGVANLVIRDPNMIANTSVDTLGVSGATYAGTDSPTGVDGETGMTYSPGDPTSPYTSLRTFQDSGGGVVTLPTYFWTPYVTITLKSNSSALTAKQGRLYMGACYVGEGFNAASTQFDQLQTFQNWGVDQVTSSAMPVFRWIPTSYWEIDSEEAYTTGRLYPSIVVCGIGLVANTVLEFEFEYASVAASGLVQFVHELEYNTDAVQGVLHGMRKSLPKGFSHTVAQTKRAQTDHEHATAIRALRDQPVLPAVVAASKPSSKGNIIEKIATEAVDALPTFFGNLFG